MCASAIGKRNGVENRSHHTEDTEKEEEEREKQKARQHMIFDDEQCYCVKKDDVIDYDVEGKNTPTSKENVDAAAPNYEDVINSIITDNNDTNREEDDEEEEENDGHPPKNQQERQAGAVSKNVLKKKKRRERERRNGGGHHPNAQASEIPDPST